MQWAKQKQSGFTIVELLIVIVVIAILAAITIVAYNGIQQRSRVSTAQTQLSNLSKKLELYKVDNNVYPTSGQNSVWRGMFNEVAGDVSDPAVRNFVVCRTSTGDRYAVIAWTPISPSSGATMYYIGSSQNGVSTTTYTGQGSYGSVSESACAVAGYQSAASSWTQHL
jgi:prepilin-type N-terminal cleavage/methylation domain-containing protein